MERMELLAPAGSLETFQAVLAAGADAVYVGGAQFGARAYAKNFTQDELLYAIDYAHLFDKKLHLTVNTLLKNREIEEQLYDYLLVYYERGLDAVIVQDAGVFSFIKTHFPGLELHTSTQMTVTGSAGAAYWKDRGADRIVLSRELSIDEIAAIHNQVDVELECFIHGALCYSYSGQCLFSSILGQRSGNRGRCAQPCRLSYEPTWAERRKNGPIYPLSPKDLCGIDWLPELRKAGVSSLKIEGRMKQTAYAAGVTAIYRKYLDILELSDEVYHVSDEDRKRLMELGNRSGFTDGYFRNEKGPQMMSLSSSSHSSANDLPSEAFGGELKRTVLGTVHLHQNESGTLTIQDCKTGKKVSVSCGEISSAKNAPATEEAVRKVLLQTGESFVTFSDLEIIMDDESFVPKQFLKSLRRDGISLLKKELLSDFRRYGKARSYQRMEISFKKENEQNDIRKQLTVICDSFEQLQACCNANYDFITDIGICLHMAASDQMEKLLNFALEMTQACNYNAWIVLPTVFRESTVCLLEKNRTFLLDLFQARKIQGFYAKNYDSIGYLLGMGIPSRAIRLDASVYTFSNRASEFFLSQGFARITFPYELNAKELKHKTAKRTEMVIYGYYPLMVSNQCVNKNLNTCDRIAKQLSLKDRYEKQFIVKNYCSFCYNVIYNSMPMMLFDNVTRGEIDAINPESMRIDFTVESPKRVIEILDCYKAFVLEGILEHAQSGEFTRGHFKRGVE
ncbi:MAG: U32 family peptidase [bacterium]|nr:U32 family peptidase [bacterium]